MPGVLKNAIDWLSRDPPVLVGKPVAVVGATTGPWGTRYAQQMLRHVLGATGCIVMTSPQLFVRHAAEAFDGGDLVDPGTAEQLEAVVAALAQWTRAFTRDLAVC
jgi:chromate reductase